MGERDVAKVLWVAALAVACGGRSSLDLADATSPGQAGAAHAAGSGGQGSVGASGAGGDRQPPCLDPLPPPLGGYARNPCGGPLHRPRVEVCPSQVSPESGPPGACVEDAECGPGAICVCGDPIGRCLASTCISDAECGGRYRCRLHATTRCGEAFACETVHDQCRSDRDCSDDHVCAPTPSGFFLCDKSRPCGK